MRCGVPPLVRRRQTSLAFWQDRPRLHRLILEIRPKERCPPDSGDRKRINSGCKIKPWDWRGRPGLRGFEPFMAAPTISINSIYLKSAPAKAPRDADMDYISLKIPK